MSVAGLECKAHYFAVDMSQSDDCFVAAFPTETTEAFLEGHVRTFAYFEEVPRQNLYDNTKLAVAKILGDGERKKTRAFCELQSHYICLNISSDARARSTTRIRLHTAPRWICSMQVEDNGVDVGIACRGGLEAGGQ